MFNEKLLKLMREKNISQKQLSELSHISEPSVSRYVSGKSQPRYDVIINFSKALGVDPSYFLRDTEDAATKEDAFTETVMIVARNKSQLSDEQKAKIIQVLFGK